MASFEDVSNQFPLEPLTWREEEILRLLVARQSDREIALSLSISSETVKWYNKRLYAKLGVKSRREAAARADELDLLKSEAAQPAGDHNLPAQTTPFVGRQRELADLMQLLQDEDRRLVTILAAGGMGKTRLAVEAAARQHSFFSDGVHFVPLAKLSSDDHIATAIADAVGLRLQAGGNPRQQVVEQLSSKQLLLLFDNLESGQGNVGIVEALLQRALNIKMLVTARQRLNLSGETVYSIGGMSVPEPQEADGVRGESDAMELFVQGARHVHPHFVVEPTDRTHIAQICQLVGGMPLAVVLAAAWVRILSTEEIVSEIRRDLDFLSTTIHNIPQRQRSIRAVFNSVWRRLSDSAKTTFEKLSLFRGGFTLAAARAVANANVPTLQVLADRGLLRRLPAGRYITHELLRQFAEEQLTQRAEYEAAGKVHSQYFAQQLVTLEPQLRSSQQAVALTTIESDIDNVQAAWEYAVANKQYAILAQMLPSLFHFYQFRGWFEEGSAAFGNAAQTLTTVTRSVDETILLGRLFGRQGACVQRLRQDQKAAQLLQLSLTLLNVEEARAERAFTLSFMADLARRLGKYEMTRQLCEQSLALFKEAGDL